MDQFLQLLVAGLATGAVYALAAMGFTLLWQTAGTINFAQGEFVMLPAFLMLGWMSLAGLDPWPAFALTVLCSMLVLGLAFKRLLADPLMRHDVLTMVIASIALGLFLKESVKELWSSEAQPFPDLLPAGSLALGGVVISLRDLVVFAVAAGLSLLLQILLARTRTGRAMQAVAQNREVARIVGIDVPRMVLLTFLANALLVTVAALLVTPVYLAKFDLGESLGLMAFIAAIVGGFNQPRGALVGGLLVGLLDNLSATYVSAAYRSALPLLLLVVIILVRPQGLLGRLEERQV